MKITVTTTTGEEHIGFDGGFDGLKPLRFHLRTSYDEGELFTEEEIKSIHIDFIDNHQE